MLGIEQIFGLDNEGQDDDGRHGLDETIGRGQACAIPTNWTRKPSWDPCVGWIPKCEDAVLPAPPPPSPTTKTTLSGRLCGFSVSRASCSNGFGVAPEPLNPKSNMQDAQDTQDL